MTSIWTVAALGDDIVQPLAFDTKVDVAVIGGGITGLTTALKLSDAGHSVAVLEAWQIGRGNTGNSTGNLYATRSSGLAEVQEKWNDDVVRAVVEERGRAVDFIEQTSARFAIDCQFRRCPAHFCVRAEEPQLLTMLEREHGASQQAQLSATMVDSLPAFPLPIRRALRIDDQAQFNPLPYVQGLAQALRVRGVKLHEHCRVLDVDAGAGRITTGAGTLCADEIVVATHVPLGINLVQAEMEPYREYGIARPLSRPDHLPAGIFWIQGESRSLRSYRHRERDYLVVVGEKHKTGHQGDGSAYWDRLGQYADEHFGAADATASRWRWSAQQYRSADGLPYIGRSAHRNIHIATGFAADGLVWGTVAADLIVADITGRASACGDLFNPRRFTPRKSAQVWLAENKTVAAHLLHGLLLSRAKEAVASVPAGEGRIVEVEGDRVAAYRGLDGALSLVSPLCPHMKCQVHWNSADTTWDCPCHGSRFNTDGSVIEGPAYEGLTRFDLDRHLPPQPT